MTGPVTLTQQQFQQLRPGGNYQSYLSFVANRRGVPASSLTPPTGGGSGAAPGAADPASALANLLGHAPLTSAQIEKQAQSEISPIIAAVTGQANQQAATQGSQINALTQDYANELGQINFGSPYQSAEGQQAAVDAALQQSLTGQGSTLASGLADKLKALQGTSGAPALQQAADALSSQGQSIGNTQLASGSAALENLIANQAAATNLGQKLPVVAKLSGLQALGESASQQQKNIGDATLQAESQIPSIVQDLTANQQTALANAVSAQQKQQALDLDEAVKDATLGQGQEKVTISQQNAKTAASRAAASAQAAMARAQIAQQNATTAAQRAKADAAYKVAEIKLRQAQAKVPKASSLKEWNALADQLYNGVQPHYRGVTVKDTKTGDTHVKWVSVPGTGAPPVKWGQAVAKLVAAGASKAQAVQILDAQGWQPGEGGRPMTQAQKQAIAHANAVQAAAGAAITDPTSTLTGGH